MSEPRDAAGYPQDPEEHEELEEHEENEENEETYDITQTPEFKAAVQREVDEIQARFERTVLGFGPGSHGRIRELAIQAFEIDPQEADLVQVEEILKSDQKPTTKAEVDFCLRRRKFLNSWHDPPELFACSYKDRFLCIARFKAFVSPPVWEGMTDTHIELVKLVKAEFPGETDTMVADLVGQPNKDGDHPRFRVTIENFDNDMPKMGAASFRNGERLSSVALMSKVSSTQDESLTCLMDMFSNMVFALSGWSTFNIVQRPGSNARKGTKPFRTVQYLCLLLNTDAGNDTAEIAWLSRHFEIGFGGYPPQGNSCTGAFVNLLGAKPFTQYSCVVSDAPQKCQRCSRNPSNPSGKPEHFLGFVKVMWDHTFTVGSVAPSDDVFAVELPKGPPGPGEEETGPNTSVKVQSVNHCLDHIGEVEVDVGDVRFTQNTISSRFLNGDSVKALAGELRSNPDQAQSLRLQVFEHEGAFYSLDNRRLFALKVAEAGHVKAEKVRIRRDLLNSRLTTTCSGRLVVFGDDRAIPAVTDLQVTMDNGEGPAGAYQVQMTRLGDTEPLRQKLQASEIVKIQVKNHLPVKDDFQDIFHQVMCDMAFPPDLRSDKSKSKKGSKKRK